MAVDSTTGLLNERAAAQILGCTASALRKWRLFGRGPAYIRVGRLIRYREADLAAFIERNRVEA